jgi:hypothetical protein
MMNILLKLHYLHENTSLFEKFNKKFFYFGFQNRRKPFQKHRSQIIVKKIQQFHHTIGTHKKTVPHASKLHMDFHKTSLKYIKASEIQYPYLKCLHSLKPSPNMAL